MNGKITLSVAENVVGHIYHLRKSFYVTFLFLMCKIHKTIAYYTLLLISSIFLINK
jgi:hypothetical protein